MKETRWPNKVKGSWSLQSRYRSSRGFSVRTEATSGFPISYKSSEAENKGEKMVVKFGSKLSDTESNANEFVASQIGGPDVGDGGGHGGHGHEGNNGGGNSNNNNNNNGYGDSEHNDSKLLNTIWWSILQCIRMLIRTTTTMWGSGRPELVWLAMVENACEFIAANLMMSAGLTSSIMAPSVIAVTEVMVVLFSEFLCFLAELDTTLTVLMSVIFAGPAAVTAGVTWAVVSFCSKWNNFP